MFAQFKKYLVLSLTLSVLPATIWDTGAAMAYRQKGGGGGGGGYSGGGGNDLQTLPPQASPLDHNNRAVALGRRGIWDQAVKEHEIALNGDPYNTTFKMNLSGAYLRYGQALMAKGMWRDAIQRFHMAIYVDPNNAAAHEGLDAALKRIGKDPNDWKVRKDLGEELDSNSNYPEAIAEFRAYVRITDSGVAHAALATVLLKQGQNVPARAVEGFNEMKLALSKDWPEDQKMELGNAHLRLADTLKELAAKARDDTRYETALKRYANAAIEYRRAATLFGNKKLDGARGLVEVAREAVAIQPRSFDNHMMLGGGYLLEGDYERAKKEYETCWRLRPSDPKLAQARAAYHRAVMTSPGVNPMLVAASVQKVEELLKKNPNDAELLYIYGRGKDALGEHEVALQAYQAAMQVNPYVDPDLPRRLGLVPTAVASAPGGKGQAVAPVAGSLNPGQTPVAATPGGAPAFVPGVPAGGGPPPPPVNQNKAALDKIQGKMSSDAEGAQKDLMALLDKDPREGKAWLMLGQLNEQKKEFDDASVAFRQASYLLPNDQEVKDSMKRIDTQRAQPFVEKGDKAVAENKLVEAKEAYKQAISVYPDEIAVHKKLLEVLKKLGDAKEIEQENNAINKIMNPPAAPPPKPAAK